MSIRSSFGFRLFQAEASRHVRASGGFVVLCFVLCFALAGCFPVRHTPPEARPPTQLVTYYLKGMFSPAMQREVYDLLTFRARDAVSYDNFVSLRNNEVSRLAGRSSPADTRVFVSLFDQYDFSDDHSLIYALLTVRHPYSIGERERYALVRLHCHREGEGWAIQPFMHAPTGTVILIPTRMRGPLWKISDDMETITRLVGDEISAYGKQEEPLPEKAVAAESPEEPPLVIPEVLVSEALELPPHEPAIEKKVDALLSIGRLCYEAGKVDAAEDTFRRVLALDPNNTIARDYLSRCENYRLLQTEKEEAVRLMEELLRLDTEERSPK